MLFDNNNDKLNWFAVVLCLFSLFTLVGCGSFNAKSLNTILATDAKKEQLLSERVRRFNQALYWGDAKLAIAYVAPKKKDEIFRRAKKSRKTEHYVDLEVQKIDYVDDIADDEKETAKVTIGVQYYKTPNYIIKDRIEQQTWVFERFSGGWFLDELETISHEDNT